MCDFPAVPRYGTSSSAVPNIGYADSSVENRLSLTSDSPFVILWNVHTEQDFLRRSSGCSIGVLCTFPPAHRLRRLPAQPRHFAMIRSAIRRRRIAVHVSGSLASHATLVVDEPDVLYPLPADRAPTHLKALARVALLLIHRGTFHRVSIRRPILRSRALHHTSHSRTCRHQGTPDTSPARAATGYRSRRCTCRLAPSQRID